MILRETLMEKDQYVPTQTEPFMNTEQKNYFRRRLGQWKDSLLSENDNVKSIESSTEADVADVASKEAEQSMELATRRRAGLLIDKIDQALKKIDEGTYGFCEETGEPIDIHRLIARPIATLSLEAQEKKEKLSRFQTKRHV